MLYWCCSLLVLQLLFVAAVIVAFLAFVQFSMTSVETSSTAVFHSSTDLSHDSSDACDWTKKKLTTPSSITSASKEEESICVIGSQYLAAAVELSSKNSVPSKNAEYPIVDNTASEHCSCCIGSELSGSPGSTSLGSCPGSLGSHLGSPGSSLKSSISVAVAKTSSCFGANSKIKTTEEKVFENFSANLKTSITAGKATQNFGVEKVDENRFSFDNNRFSEQDCSRNMDATTEDSKLNPVSPDPSMDAVSINTVIENDPETNNSNKGDACNSDVTANLINLDSDSSDDSRQKSAATNTKSAAAPTLSANQSVDLSHTLADFKMPPPTSLTSPLPEIAIGGDRDSGVSSTENGGRCSADIMVEDEADNNSGSCYVGVANGDLNGTISSLIDSPLEPMRNYSAFGPSTSSNRSRMSSSNAFASQLYNRQNGNGGSSNYSGSRRSSFNSDIDMSVSDVDAHSEISEISNQMAKIQKQLANLEDTRNDEKFVRLKQDYAVLQERYNILEEQCLQKEDQWKAKLDEERARHRDSLQRLEREKQLEIESLTYKCQLMEREQIDCQREKQKLTSELERVRAQNMELSEKVDSLEYQLGDLASDHEDTSGKYSRLKQEAEAELRAQRLLVDELTRQLEESRDQSSSHHSPFAASQSEQAAEQQAEEISRLREENRQIRETNDELQAQLIASSVAQGRSLLAAGTSLADEMDSMTKDQLLTTLRDQEIVNQKLRHYVDGILLRIIEMYPAILEIPAGENPEQPPP